MIWPKMKSFIASLFLGVFCVALCRGAADTGSEIRLSKFLYDLPAMEGMEKDLADQHHLRNGQDGSSEYCILHVVFRSKKGVTVSSQEIADFYTKYLTGKGFRSWNIRDQNLKNRFQGPSVVTRGAAYIWSQGHITYAIPEEGNFASFWIEQRRDFSLKESEPLLNEIKGKFKETAEQFGFQYDVPKYIEVSDWPAYTVNECFVERMISNIQYQPAAPGCLGNPGAFQFYFSVFPTEAHAEQWREIADKKESDLRAQRKFHFSPIRIKNVVVEYSGHVFDTANPALESTLRKALEQLAKPAEPKAAGMP